MLQASRELSFEPRAIRIYLKPFPLFHILVHLSLVDLSGIVKNDSFSVLVAFFVYLPEEDSIFVLLDVKVQKVDASKELVLGMILVLDPAHFVLVEVLADGMLDLAGGCLYVADLELMHRGDLYQDARLVLAS